MKLVRVLLIAPSLDIIGGQSVQADRLLGCLASEPSLQVRFVAINPRLPRVLRRVKYVRTLVTELWFFIQLGGEIGRADVLHIFAAGDWSFYLAPAPALLLAKLLGKKAILNYHDGRAEQFLARSRAQIRLLRLASAVVAPSDYLVDVFARFGIQARLLLNILEPALFKFRERSNPRPVFLHNRGLATEYNPACTLRAFAIVQERFPEASLIVAHDGPLRAQLETLAQELGLRNTQFIGPVVPREMAALYDDADIYLSSPDADNLPLSLLECFAAGLPVISSSVGGVPGMLRDQETGLLFPPGDHRAMAACALRLLDEPGLASRLAENARADCSRYTWPRVGPEFMRLYGGNGR